MIDISTETFWKMLKWDFYRRDAPPDAKPTKHYELTYLLTFYSTH